MVKKLRSLIHEQFPLELRVKIELLSRRRDIINKEKQEELFKLLREYDVKGIVPLGPGTNRYAFKLNGFVIKVATDHDGKIDNLKEFKMAKRLYPHVTKTYEVSENGTLLVAEYIQPFGSYAEMLKYADKIRDILTELSSVYLIGDVGITNKNYANWGLRIGSEDPVCLDFAYVYDVSSDLFVCKACKTGSMLVPNKDFTALVCPAPGCGKQYQFEEIRMRIGNDLHRHEIGDLTDEGYALTSSHVDTELIPSRSNYLERKKSKVEKPKKVEEVVELDNFELPDEPGYYIKEDTIMKDNRTNAGPVRAFTAPVIKAMAWPVSAPKPAAVIPAAVEEVEEDVLAFSGDILDIPVVNGFVISKDKQDVVNVPEDEQQDLDEDDAAEDSDEFLDRPVESGFDKYCRDLHHVNPDGSPLDDDDVAIPPDHMEGDTDVCAITDISKEELDFLEEEGRPIIVEATVVTSEPPATKDEEEEVCAVPEEPKAVAEPVVEKKKPPIRTYTDSFLNNARLCVSKFSNKIQDDLHNRDVYNLARKYIRRKKELAESFYKATQNAVFRSLLIFCDFHEFQAPNDNPNHPGVHRDWAIPEVINGMPYEPTIIFLERFWNTKKVNLVENASEVMTKYRSIFGDYQGIQREWIPIFIDRYTKKYPIDRDGAALVAEAIAEMWCVPAKEEVEEPEQPVPADQFEEIPENVANYVANDVVPVVEESAAEEPSEPTIHPFTEESVREALEIYRQEHPDETNDDESELAFSADMLEMDNDEEDEDDDESVDPEATHFCVEIYPAEGDDELDVVRIESSDAYGPIHIPIYAELDKINPDSNLKSMVDDRNGCWDWLIHMVPDLLFRTDRPEFWLSQNDDPDVDQMRVVILDENDGIYTMGLYYLLGIYKLNDETDELEPAFDEELLAKLNYLITTEIGYTQMSHLRRTLAHDELIYDEAHVLSMISEVEEDGGEEDDSDEEAEGFTDAEMAALNAVLGTDDTPDEDHRTFKPIRRTDVE